MRKTRNLALLLAALLVLSSSCSSGADSASETSGETQTAAESTETAAETSLYEPDELPALDYDGADFTVFVEDYGGYCGPDYLTDSMNGEIVNDAIYTRNQKVSERLNINLKWDAFTHGWDDRDKFFSVIRSGIASASGAWDVLAASGYFMPSMTDLLQEMDDLPYIDIEKPWWSEKYMENAAIEGKYYYVTGDASLGILKNMFCIFFNSDLYSSLGIDEDLYQLVYDGEWTLDKLAEIAGSVYGDLNGDGKKDKDDQYGLMIKQNNMWTGFLESLGVDIAELNGSTVDFTFGSERAVSAVERLQTLKKADGVFYYSEGHTETMDDSPFLNGNSLFATGWLMHADTYRSSDFAYGILPYPKWDEASDYSTTVLTTYFVHSLPKDCPDAERAAAVLEAFASESYRTVTPAYFEIALKTKYAADNDVSKVFDIIRGGIDFNFGYIYTFAADGISDQFKTIINAGSSWSSAMAKTEAKTTALYEALISEIISIGE